MTNAKTRAFVALPTSWAIILSWSGSIVGAALRGRPCMEFNRGANTTPHCPRVYCDTDCRLRHEPHNLSYKKAQKAQRELFVPFVPFCGDYLKQLELDRQILLRVLAEVVDHFDALGRELVHVGVQRVVVEELADRAFATLGGGDHVVDAFGSCVKARDGRASVVVDLFVTNQFAKRTAAGIDVCDDEVDLVH